MSEIEIHELLTKQFIWNSVKKKERRIQEIKCSSQKRKKEQINHNAFQFENLKFSLHSNHVVIFVFVAYRTVLPTKHQTPSKPYYL